MKACKQLFTMCLLAVFAACSDDTFVPQAEVDSTAESGSVDLVCMVVPDIEMDVTTRSKLYEDGDALKFEWQENDAIGVIPMTGNPLRFPIHAENAGKNTALFDGGGWALKSDEKYAAFYPYKKENYEKDVKSITYSYYGQTQGNFSYYDFLATGAVMPSNGQVTFNMKRLSAILKFSITMPADSYGRYGSLVSPDADFGVEGTLDLSGSEPIMKKSYSKTVNTQIAADKTSSSEWTYEVYLMIPATNLSGKELMFRITSDNGDAYEVPLEGKNFEAGKAYLLEGEAGEAKRERDCQSQERGEQKNVCHAGDSGCGSDGHECHQCLRLGCGNSCSGLCDGAYSSCYGDCGWYDTDCSHQEATAGFGSSGLCHWWLYACRSEG